MWKSEGPIECVRFNIKTVVFHGFRGSEFDFIHYLAREGMSLSTIGVVCDSSVLDTEMTLPLSGYTGEPIFVYALSAGLTYRSLSDPCVWYAAPFEVSH